MNEDTESMATSRTDTADQHEQVPPAPTATFEAWATTKLGVSMDARGRASGVIAGRRVSGATQKAAFVNAARTLHRIPIGKRMTEAQFDEYIEAVKAIEVSDGSR